MKNANVKLSLVLMAITLVLIVLGVYVSKSEAIESSLTRNLLQMSGGAWLGVDSPTNGLIVQNGNAGIGTTNPSVKLDVVGDIKASNSLCIGATCKTSWPSDCIVSSINSAPAGYTLTQAHTTAVNISGASYCVNYATFCNPSTNGCPSASVWWTTGTAPATCTNYICASPCGGSGANGSAQNYTITYDAYLYCK